MIQHAFQQALSKLVCQTFTMWYYYISGWVRHTTLNLSVIFSLPFSLPFATAAWKNGKFKSLNKFAL